MSRRAPSITTLVEIGWLGVMLLCCPLVFAQGQEIESEVPARETAADAQARELAIEASLRQVAEGYGDITLAHVLADPDNIELNVQYAKAQVAKGELLSAAGTLERILLIHPELTSVRLFYAIVLFRLDNLEESERALLAVSEHDMTASLRQEIEEYLSAIRQRRQRTRYFASLAMGWQFDTNRNAAPSSKQRLLFDLPTGVSGTSSKRRDTSFLINHSFRVNHDLGYQAGHQLLASFNYYLGEQTVVDSLDLQSFSMEFGGVLKTPHLDVTPLVSLRHLFLSRETFLRSQEFGAALDKDVTKRLHVSTGGRWAREDYVAVEENLAAPQRRGHRVTVDLGARYVLTPTMRLGVDGSFTDKDSTKGFLFNSYEGATLTGNHTWLVGRGQFLISALSYTVNSYDVPDVAISVKKRLDRQVRARVTYGAPLELLIGKLTALTPYLEDSTVTFTVEQFRSMSNITNYSYRNTKLNMLITKSIEF